MDYLTTEIGSRGAFHKEFSDPLYGFVGANKEEVALIDHPVFQRLRYIKQLGLAYLVFPSANHSRFEHALGVMSLSDRVYTRACPDQDPRERTILRIAGLLHDVGHTPFSHTVEGLLPADMNHEDMTRRVILESEILSVLRDVVGLSEEEIGEVVRITTGKPISDRERFLSEIINGQFGSDRMDYIRRDALFCGVSYGNFDMERLLSTIRVIEKGRRILAVDISGLRALESFFLGRYFMYLQVYFHRVVRILNIHLVELIDRVMGGDLFDNLGSFLELTDDSLRHILRAKGGDGELYERVFGREHYREVFSCHSRDEFEQVKEFLLSLYPEEDLRFDAVSKEPLDEEVFVLKGDDILPVREVSEVLSSLKPIEIYRVYVKPELKGEICARLRG